MCMGIHNIANTSCTLNVLCYYSASKVHTLTVALRWSRQFFLKNQFPVGVVYLHDHTL